MASIDEAIAALQRPKPGLIKDVVEEHGIHLSTLLRRARGVTTLREEAAASRVLLTKSQQLVLIKYINELCEYGLLPTTTMVRNFAEEIAYQRPGRNWVSRFNQSNADVLSLKYLAGADQARAKADNWWEYSQYFEQVSGLISL